MDGTGDRGGASGPDPASAILERLDGIGRLLAEGLATPALPSRPSGNDAHLVTRIDMLGRIVEQVLADREEGDAKLAALTRRLVDLEGRLAPALETCAERLAEAVPLLAEAALDRLPSGGVALRVALRELRDAVASLDRRIVMADGRTRSAPTLPARMHPRPVPGAAPDAGPSTGAARDGPPGGAGRFSSPRPAAFENQPEGPLILMGAIPDSAPSSTDAVPATTARDSVEEASERVVAEPEEAAPDQGGEAVLRRLLTLSRQDAAAVSNHGPAEQQRPPA